jgi:5,5'-dehydrodivanillate O-demethylase
VEERGIACAYHGWLYDTEGHCLETPAEPADSKLHLTVRQRAYPVQKFCGMYWAYLGPLPAPVIPKIDVWVRKDGRRKLSLRPRLDCNWLQGMENSIDPAHLQILHQNTSGNGRVPASTTRGFTDDVKAFEFEEFEFGFVKRRFYADGLVDEHPLIFPNILRQGAGTHIRVPMDDTHTLVYYVLFVPSEDGNVADDEEPSVQFLESYKDPPDGHHPFARFRMDRVDAQDYMVWETQGPLANREVERLATSDRGVVMYRQMLKEQIERVQRGLDPIGTVRDPGHDVIDTKLSESIAEMELRGQPPSTRQLTPA